MMQETLGHLFAEWFERHIAAAPRFIKPVKSFAIAVSGGPDSMALLAVMAKYANLNKIKLHVLSVDHGLREEAKDEIKMVAEWVSHQKSQYLLHQILTWRHEKLEAAIMENARKARYDLMAQYSNENDIQILLLGHHQDDQAETFLIRLAKGSGLDGLGGMQPLQNYNDKVTLARPFLSMPKTELIAYCDTHKIPYALDPSNENNQYLRPRLRASMEVLGEEGLTPKRLAMTAKRLSRARQALEEISDNAYHAIIVGKEEAAVTFDYNALKSCPPEIGFRVIAKAVEMLRPLADYQVRMEKLENLVDDVLQDKTFKARTLGGCKFSLNKTKEKPVLIIEREFMS